ncbi:AAA family ATPase [Nocardia sp. NPDC051463]|uniref:AAA family ATPase n=1 Tax=Nocardia sp. NPDC051463 TaxID=3154845 RepID=UPI00343832DD
MDKLLVLINGLPGSGKSTLGRSLAVALDAQFLSKDAIKEALATAIGNVVGASALGGIAMDTVWALAQATPTTVVVDSWWFRPRDLQFARAGIERVGPDRVVEVWCDVPSGVARSRYASRRRAVLHQDEQRLANDWDAWAEWAAPLGLAPVVVADTTRPVDCIALATRIERVVMAPIAASSTPVRP